MKYRFFTKTTPSGENVKLFLLAIDEEKEELDEYFLSNKAWEETSDLMKIMIDGFQGIREISQEEAMEIYKSSGLEDAMKKLGNTNG